LARTKKAGTEQIAVIGLGRFGAALSLELVETGHEVLGIDIDEQLVQSFSTQITQTVQADSTSPEALTEIDINNFERVVVAIGSNVEASILTASLLLELGIKEIWAKADTDAHGRILQQLGVHHVVFPESDMGRRVAHQVGGDSLDYVEIDKGFVMAKTGAAKSLIGKSLTELALRSKYGVLVVATSHGDAVYTAATPETLISDGDWMIIAGPKNAVDHFCELR
jgi:trk system potassium uptake protein TrkA